MIENLRSSLHSKVEHVLRDDLKYLRFGEFADFIEYAQNDEYDRLVEAIEVKEGSLLITCGLALRSVPCRVVSDIVHPLHEKLSYTKLKLAIPRGKEAINECVNQIVDFTEKYTKEMIENGHFIN